MGRSIFSSIIAIACGLIFACCQPRYRDSYDGITPEELATLSTPVYPGDATLIYDELVKWKNNYTSDELAHRIMVASAATDTLVQGAINTFVIEQLLPDDKEDIPKVLEHSRALYKYYPDKFPPWLVETLGRDFDRLKELRKQLGIPEKVKAPTEAPK